MRAIGPYPRGRPICHRPSRAAGERAGTTCRRNATITTPTRVARVVLGTSCEVDDLDAARWAAAYAARRGHDTVVVRSPSRTDGSTARALVAESFTADLIVTGSRTEADRALALAAAAAARCPVVAVPPGATWHDELPALVDVDGGPGSGAVLRSGFALAAVLGAGVRAICCTREPFDDGSRPTPTARAATAAVAECARSHPDVPVDLRVARSHPVTGLVRHARLAALLVVGRTPTTDDRASGLLDRCSTPVALIGPRVIA